MNSKQIIEKYHLDKYRWVKKGASSVLHTMFPAATNLVKPLRNYWGDGFNIFVYFIIDDYLYWYYNTDDMTRLRKSVVDKLNSNLGWLSEHETRWREYVSIFEKTCKKIDQTNLEELSDQELIELYQEHYDAYVQEYALAMGLLESFSMQVDEFFRPALEKLLQHTEYEFNKVYSLLLSPVQGSFINHDYIGRLEIMKAIQKGIDIEEVDLMYEAHAKKFFWIENNYTKVRVLDVDYFKAKIANEMKLDINPDIEISNIEQGYEEIRKQKASLIKELDLSLEMQNVIKATEVFAVMQDDRKKCVLISNYYQKKFLDEIGRRLGLTEKQMDYTIFPEISNMLLKKSVDVDMLAQRQKASVCIETLDGYQIYSGQTALDIFNSVYKKEIKEVELTGMCASPGKIKGIVKIIRKNHDLASVNKGEIIVTSMTRPDMIVATEKASGIITDEGGVTSHAAIISRELKIPCIIGTKNATEVLQNGDYVELDADLGKVNKLS